MKHFIDLVTTVYDLAGVAETTLSLILAVGLRIPFIRKMRESD